MKYLAVFAATAATFGWGVAHAVTLAPASLEAEAGSTAVVNINVNNATNLAGLQFVLDYGARTPASASALLLSADDVEVGPFLPGASLVVNPSATSLRVAMASVRGKTGSGAILRVPLAIPASAPVGAKYTLRLREALGTDANANQVIPTVTDGTLTVKAKPPVLGITLSKASGPSTGTATLEISGTADLINVAGAQFIVRFDPAVKATADDVTLGGLIKGATLQVNDQTPGMLRCVLASSRGSSGPGLLARVQFHLPSVAAGTRYPVTLNDLQIVDASAASMNVYATAGELTVTGPRVIEGGLLSVSSVRAMNGGVARLDITVNEKITGLSGAQFRLLFHTKTPSDSPDLKVTDDVAVGRAIPGASVELNDKTPGELFVAMASSQSGGGPGLLLSVPFQVPVGAAQGAVYSVEVKDVLFSVNGAEASAASEGGTITVEHRRKGDVANKPGGEDAGDGQVTVADAIAQLQIIINTIPFTGSQANAADLNNDGKVTVADVVKLLRVIAQLEPLN